MFTGIVTHCVEILSVQQTETNLRLTIRNPSSDLVLGESIAVDGACLTVVKFSPSRIEFELSAETLQCTIASQYQSGQHINLERALRVQDRLGGHWVTGHVDQLATLLRVEQHGEFRLMEFKLTQPEASHLVPKGSITLNGVSLTLNTVTAQTFTVMLIPHTLQHTNLSLLQKGAQVNVEIDILSKMIAQQVENYLRNAANTLVRSE